MLRWLAVILLLGWAQPVHALNVDVGMLTQVEGEVAISAGKAEKRPAEAFTKVAIGDRLELGKEAQVQIVYFETSRQENWSGQGLVEIGNGEGFSPGLQAEVRNLPPLVARQLVKTPVSGRHGKTGMVMVRSLSSDTVESLEKQYLEFRGSAEEGDTTPEVFLLTGLMEMEEFEHAQSVLEGLKENVTETPALAGVIEHFEPLVEEGLAGL